MPEAESKAGKIIPSPMTSAMTTKKSPTPQSTKASNDSFQDGLFWKKQGEGGKCGVAAIITGEGLDGNRVWFKSNKTKQTKNNAKRRSLR